MLNSFYFINNNGKMDNFTKSAMIQPSIVGNALFKQRNYKWVNLETER